MKEDILHALESAERLVSEMLPIVRSQDYIILASEFIKDQETYNNIAEKLSKENKEGYLVLAEIRNCIKNLHYENPKE